jgi:hypothetical protein
VATGGTRKLSVQEANALSTAGFDITGLTASQYAVAKDMIARATQNGWSNQTLANRLKPVIGLGPRYAAAVENMRAGLSQGITVKQKNGKSHKRKLNSAQIDARVKQYTDRLQKSRARTVAQNQLSQVKSNSQRQQWLIDQANGLIPMTTKKVFMLGQNERHCKVCQAIDGTKSELSDTSNLPPIHPNCGCYEIIEDGVTL